MSRVRDLADNNVVFVDGITTADITEHTNLFFTDARADARLALKMVDEDNMSSNSAAHMPTQQSVKAYVDTEVASLVDSSPSTLDTLNELAAALGDDANFSTTVTNSIATKLPLAGGTMTGALIINAGDNGLDVRVGTDKRILFAGNIGEIGSVAGFQAVNTAGNANTAFGIRATDIRFATGSDERVRITDAGVGIGATSPSDKLEVSRTSTDQTVGLTLTNLQAGGYGSGIVWKSKRSDAPNNILDAAKIVVAGENSWNSDGDTASQMQFWTQKDNTLTKHMTLNKNGNLGIGTTSPTNVKLQINKSGSDTVGDGHIGFGGGSTPLWAIRAGAADFDLRIDRSYAGWQSNPALSIRRMNGNVGIGTDTASTKLHVKSGGSGNSNGSLYLEIDTATNYPAMVIQTATGGNTTETHGLYIKNTAAGYGLRIDDTSGDTSPFVVDSGGKVGIGTDSPDGKLTVALENSNTPAFRLASPTSSTDFAISNYNDANGTYVSMGVNHLFDASGNDAVMDTNDKSAAIVLDGRNNGRIQFLTNSSGIATPRMTILQDGKVGIGTTSPVENLDLRFSGRHGIICGSTSGAGSYIVLDGAGNGDGAGGDYAYIEHTSSGNLNFNVGNGSNSTNTKMLIEPAGNVGIGMSDPSYKLDVGGIGAIQQRLKSSGDTGYTQGALVIESSDSSSNPGNRGQGVYYYNVPNQRTWYTGTLYNNGNKFGFGYRQVSGFQVDAADNLHAVMVIDGDSTEVGIGVTDPSATLHVEDDGTGGNSGHMKLGHTRTRTFYAGISSSENRWYKVLNYSTGNMFTGKVQIYITRNGGYNQTGAHKEYRASLGGYSNAVYGPLSLSGDGGEGGVASLEIGSDEGLYLRVNSSIYGGTVYVTFSGQGNMSWAYSNSTYSTSLP